jgi:FMN phosphatase YigB (HAD superfamily)
MQSPLEELFSVGNLERILALGNYNLIVCDLDDTLYDGHDDFQEVKARAAGLVSRHLPGLDQTWLEAMFEQSEALTFEAYKSSYHRLLLNIVDMYTRGCEIENCKPMAVRIGELFELVDEVFSEENYAKKGLLEGSAAVLRAMKANQINGSPNILLLYTQGGERLQVPKIKGLQLNQMFDSAEIVGRKSTHTYRELLEKYGEGPAVMIGNSRHHDIKPALEAGFRGAVYIANEPWGQDSKGEVPAGENIMTYSSMLEASGDIPGLLRFLSTVLG